MATVALDRLTKRYAGGQDAFVAKLTSNGTPLWSTYLGAWNVDAANFLAASEVGGMMIAATETSEIDDAVYSGVAGSDCK